MINKFIEEKKKKARREKNIEAAKKTEQKLQNLKNVMTI